MSLARLIIAPEARRDILAILEHLEQEAGRAVAARYGSRFRSLLRDLRLFPLSGAARPELAPGLRLRGVAPYVLFYRTEDDGQTILVLRVLDGRRDMSERLFRP